MKYLRELLAACIMSFIASIMFTSSAFAQADPVQILDTITLEGTDFTIELNTDNTTYIFDPLVPQDATNDPGRNFVDCVRTPTTGLTCIDDDDIRFWQNPVGPTTAPTTLFNCGHPDLPFNTRRGNGCTAIERDMAGAIYLGGGLNGTANILIKVIKLSGSSCPTHFDPFAGVGGNFCWTTIGTGRPRIEDIDILESSQAEVFSTDGKAALLVLEEKKTVLAYHNFVDNPTQTVIDEIGSGKRDFNLIKNEQIQNAMLMEYVRPDDDTSEFFVVVTTDQGRVISIDTDGNPSGADPFVVATLNFDPSDSCLAGDDSFDVAQGPDGGLVYITDRNSCVLHALPIQSDGTSFDFDGFDAMRVNSTSTIDLPPTGISVFPGIGFDLNDCVGAGCILISSGGVAAATLANANVVSVPSGVILFHETNVPHCGWIPETCVDFLGGSSVSRDDAVGQLCDAGVLLPVDPTEACSQVPLAAPPAEVLVFNVTPFLSEDITDQIELTGQPPVTPPILFPPEYRAQYTKGFLFDLLAFVPEPGVETDGVMTLDVNVSLLTTGTAGPPRCGNEPGTWDVMLRASERWRSPDAAYSPDDENFQGTMINADCFNPTRGRTGGISVFPVDFELTDWPATIQSDGSWASDVCDPDGPPCDFDDAVFAKLHVKLFDELLAHLLELACTNTDSGQEDGMGNPIAPLSSDDCATLEDRWWIAKDKLSKGLLAVINQSNSAPNQTFQAFLEAFDNYRTTLLNANTTGREDPANRIGEQAARLETLEHLFLDKVLESAEPNGYYESDSTWAELL